MLGLIKLLIPQEHDDQVILDVIPRLVAVGTAEGWKMRAAVNYVDFCWRREVGDDVSVVI